MLYQVSDFLGEGKNWALTCGEQPPIKWKRFCCSSYGSLRGSEARSGNTTHQLYLRAGLVKPGWCCYSRASDSSSFIFKLITIKVFHIWLVSIKNFWWIKSIRIYILLCSAFERKIMLINFGNYFKYLYDYLKSTSRIKSLQIYWKHSSNFM